MDKQEVKVMLKVVTNNQPGKLSYLAVISDRTLVVESEPTVQEEPDRLELELYGYLFGAVCSAIAGAVCGLTMALML